MKIKLLKDQFNYKAGDIISLPRPIAYILIWSINAEIIK